MAQFREKQAYPLIVDFFSISEDDEFFLEVTEDVANNVGRILASVCGGDDRLIKSLIENDDAYKYARGEAIGALVCLVQSGEKSREDVLAYFKTLFQEKLTRDPEFDIVWEQLVEHATALYPEELYEDIKQVYADELVKGWFIKLEHVEHQLALTKERILKRLPRNYSLIEDAIADMKSGMFSFQTKDHEQVSNALFELTINSGIFPREALTKAIELREQVTPRLLGYLETTEKYAYEQRDNDNLMLHIYALYLLAQFREQRAYPIIINFFSLPGKISLEITGDVVTEDLHRILASVYDGDDTLLKNLIEDEQVNEYVRDAGIRTFVTLVVCGQKSRDEVIAYLKTLFGKLERKPSFTWNSLVYVCMDLYPEEVDAEIRQVAKEGLTEEVLLTKEINILGLHEEALKKSYALGKEKTLEKLQNDDHYTLIDDTIRELKDWSCFDNKLQENEEPKLISEPEPEPEPEPRYAEMRTGPKIGRNDPCSCGSGKKYKKCCGA
ncbi:conserved hypothetical protein [Beggiatoa sp. PS]|nr:conserved hypothetical protein [Beggiatoa sp. PS]